MSINTGQVANLTLNCNME